MTTLNQIRMEYTNSLSEIPEKQLKELFNDLFYRAYHTYFIDDDKESFDKFNSTLDTLINETEPMKRYRAGREAPVKAPVKVLFELYNKNRDETRETMASYLSLIFLITIGDLEMNNAIIECIDNCTLGNERKCLENIRETMVKIKDVETALLKKHHEKQQGFIDYLENKSELAEHETEALKRMKEGVGIYG